MLQVRISFACLVLAGVASLAFAESRSAAGSKSALKPVDFARDVLPIFQSHCYQCHDGRKRTSGLRLDIRENAFRGGDSGSPAIVAKDCEKSELLRRVMSSDSAEMMPPKGKRLSTIEIAMLKRWIDEGAPWPDSLAGGTAKPTHWAFVPPERPALPRVKDSKWCRNDIDRFVLARLEKEHLRPSPEADRTTLIRRVTLDLIGLPPTPAEVDAFIADKSPDAYEKVVDRLLASPHYGERWGREWLDAARYADSDGYEKDKPRWVWFYRDWVINSLNRDQPFDRFIIDQIAGDQLPHATQEDIVATGYLRNSMTNEEGGVDPEQFRMDAMFDRMDAIGKGILGLTIQCAQCHNHKFDPLTQREYYRLMAFLNNDDEGSVTVFTPDEQKERDSVLRQIRAVEGDLKHRMPDWPQRMAAWERQATANPTPWTVLRPTVEIESTGGQKYLPLPDGSFLAQGYAPTKHTVRMDATVPEKGAAAFRLELMCDANLPRGGPGRSIQGTAALTEFAVESKIHGKNQRLKIAHASADYNPPVRVLDAVYDDRSGRHRVTGPISFAIDGKDETAWATDADPGRRNVPHQAVFTLEKLLPAGAKITFLLGQNHGGWNSDDNQNHNLGRFRLSFTTRPNAVADPVPAAVREILSIPRDRRTAEQQAAEFSYWRTTVAQWADANRRIDDIWSTYPEGTSQLVLHERAAPRDTRILKRGNFLAPTEHVDPGVPAFLNPLPPDAPPTRLTLARWLVDRRSPTTARAAVNRMWQSYFGDGLVNTPEDFGTHGERPTHPALLDWLAVEFMDAGWSRKHMHRLIVTSATYRQSSAASPELRSRDPYDHLLARGPRFRVDAEMVRDVALSASGLLNERVGGPSFHPPLPEFLFLPPVSYGPKSWIVESGAEQFRRSLYIFRYRSVPHPVLQTFDAPNGDFACVRRSRSDTPTQALITLNQPTFIECARALAMKSLREGGTTDGARIAFAFRRCVARQPDAAEIATLKSLLDKEQQHYSSPGAKPWELAAADPSHPPKLPAGTSPARVAAWTVVSRVILNLDETITKD